MSSMALKALIDEAQASSGDPAAEFCRRAVKQGHKLTRTDISNFRSIGMKQLSPAKVRALAAGLGIPAYRVAVAVLTDLGIDVPLDMATPERAIEQDVTLSPPIKKTLLLIIQEARNDASGR